MLAIQGKLKMSFKHETKERNLLAANESLLFWLFQGSWSYVLEVKKRFCCLLECAASKDP